MSVTFAICNSLEEVLENCNFQMITVDYAMFDYSISNFIDMLSFYDSAVGIISIQVPLEDDLCLWTQFSTYLASSKNLRRIEFRGVEFKHANMRLLLNAVETNDQIDALILDACEMPQLSASIFGEFKIDALLVTASLTFMYLQKRIVNNDFRTYS